MKRARNWPLLKNKAWLLPKNGKLQKNSTATPQNEQQRIHKLFKGEAATLQQKTTSMAKLPLAEKQLEALHGKIEVLQAQYESTQAAVRIQNRGIISEEGPLQKEKAYWRTNWYAPALRLPYREPYLPPT